MDLKLELDSENITDLVFEKNDLSTDSGLKSAVLISLFTDRRVTTEELPEGESDPRGWFGDAFADVDGDLIGSRLWLLAREKNTPEVLLRAEEYAREALQWLIEDGIAQSISVKAESPKSDLLALDIRIARSNGDQVNQRYGVVWSSLNAIQ